jgi:uncharacterized membrane protein
MRAVGLAFLFFGVLSFLYPMYREWVEFIVLTRNESIWLGGLLVACGALTLAIHQNRQG